jgi:plasmid stability protein
VAPLARRVRITPVQTRTWRVAAAPHDEVVWAEVRERVTTVLRGEDHHLVLRPGAVRIDRDAQTIRISAAAARIADVAASLTRLRTPGPIQEETP